MILGSKCLYILNRFVQNGSEAQTTSYPVCTGGSPWG